MRRPPPSVGRWLVAVAATAWLAACGDTVNRDIEVAPGGTRSDGGMTVNGTVRLGAGADATGADFRTVNGRIEVGEGARAGDLATVNGRVELARKSQVGAIQSVNGGIRAAAGARIGGDVLLVNGDIRLAEGVRVQGDLATVNGRLEARGVEFDGDVSGAQGDMLITDGSVVAGRVRVRKGDEVTTNEPPIIVIGPGVRVEAGLEFERPVKLFVHETASVGPVSGADPVRFSGERPDEI